MNKPKNHIYLMSLVCLQISFPWWCEGITLLVILRSNSCEKVVITLDLAPNGLKHWLLFSQSFGGTKCLMLFLEDVVCSHLDLILTSEIFYMLKYNKHYPSFNTKDLMFLCTRELYIFFSPHPSTLIVSFASANIFCLCKAVSSTDPKYCLKIVIFE